MRTAISVLRRGPASALRANAAPGVPGTPSCGPVAENAWELTVALLRPTYAEPGKETLFRTFSREPVPGPGRMFQAIVKAEAAG